MNDDKAIYTNPNYYYIYFYIVKHVLASQLYDVICKKMVGTAFTSKSYFLLEMKNTKLINNWVVSIIKKMRSIKKSLSYYEISRSGCVLRFSTISFNNSTIKTFNYYTTKKAIHQQKSHSSIQLWCPVTQTDQWVTYFIHVPEPNKYYFNILTNLITH